MGHGWVRIERIYKTEDVTAQARLKSPLEGVPPNVPLRGRVPCPRRRTIGGTPGSSDAKPLLPCQGEVPKAEGSTLAHLFSG
jgi:hypothetical protein